MEVISAEHAFDKFLKVTPNLIVADITLPCLNGFDFFNEIRKNDKYRGIPFIYLTAFNNLQAATKANADGAADYITKPLELEYLSVRIKELFPPRIRCVQI